MTEAAKYITYDRLITPDVDVLCICMNHYMRPREPILKFFAGKDLTMLYTLLDIEGVLQVFIHKSREVSPLEKIQKYVVSHQFDVL